jgi:F420-dependent oxidoreductase-like protein
MIELAIMIEGQNGLNWQRWQRIASLVENLGFAGLFRSDHFTNGNPPDLDSLELWVSLTWLAGNTDRIKFGPLVSPISFRHPAFTARMASAVDDLSGGRLELGLGAGWQVREHQNFGFELLDLRERFARFQEGLEVITHLLRSEEPLTFEGKFFKLFEATLLPKPSRPGGPPIIIGGNGAKQTLPLVARYGDEWNAVFANPSDFRKLNHRLDMLLEKNNRQPASVRRSLMTNLTFAKNDQELQIKLHGRSKQELRARGVVIGTAGEIVDQIYEFASAGVQRIMLQWLDLDDLDSLTAFAHAVLPHFNSR